MSELNVAVGAPLKTITAKLFLQSTGALVGSAITCTSFDGGNFYSGAVPGGTAAGAYLVVFYDAGVAIDSGMLYWDGTAEVNNSWIGVLMSAIKTVVDAIKVVTDKFGFTITGKVDATVIDKTGFSLSTSNTTAIIDAIWANASRTLTDKTNFTLSAGDKDTLAALIESHLLNDGDGQMLVNAIVGAIGNTNIDQTVLVAAIRADLERSGGKLATILAAVLNIPLEPLLATNYVIPDNTAIASISDRIPAALVNGKMNSNVAAIDANAITAASIAAGGLDGKGNWNVGKTGYSLSTQERTDLITDLALEVERTGGSLASVQSVVDAMSTRLDAINGRAILAAGYVPPDSDTVDNIYTKVTAIDTKTSGLTYDANSNINSNVEVLSDSALLILATLMADAMLKAPTAGKATEVGSVADIGKNWIKHSIPL